MEYNWLDASWDEKDNILPYDIWVKIEPAIQVLSSKTGVYLDPYSDTRLSDTHAEQLIREICELELPNSHQLTVFLDDLKKAVKTGRWLKFIGD